MRAILGTLIIVLSGLVIPEIIAIETVWYAIKALRPVGDIALAVLAIVLIWIIEYELEVYVHYENSFRD